MTEGENKKVGFVVDLNISRVLNTCINYTVYKNEKNIDEKIRYLIKNHLINIDIDMMLNKKINSDIIIKKLMDIWKEDPINSFRTLLIKLDNDYENFDNSTQKLINKTFTKSLKDDKISLELKLKDEDDEIQELPTGKEKIKNDSDNENMEEKEKVDIQISFTKDVLPYVIPLSCILTVKNTNMDFVKMLNDIKENPELLDIFDDQCLIWWNKTGLINLIKDIVEKYFDKKSNTYNISIQFKMSLQSLIDNPKELLELISYCLKPKDLEKKQFGEVFTPMELVNEMLDKLPEEIWKNKNLKWLDPCCGMGNFPIAVYLRLMDSLKDIIKDAKERKKHILENMVYMSELNKKNVLICKQIFDINNEYKLNIYEGNSLEADYDKEFKIKQIDIIMGNPPYQDDSGNKGKGHTLWVKFVELSLKKLLCENGYLVFVHPSLWRQPEHDMLKLLKTKQILYLEIHDEKDGQRTFRCSTRYDWYILHNTNYTKNTIIKGQDKKIYEIDLRKWNFIPNYDFYKIEKLIENNNKLNIISSRSAYGHDKKWVNKINDKIYKYPVVYSVNRQNKLTLHYSSTNENGHFGIPKVIFGSGATGFYIDEKGEYGLTQWCIGVIDTKDNLEKIKNTFESDKFKEIIKAISVSKAEINGKILKYFKKDFYIEFYDDKTENKKKIVRKKNNKIIIANDNMDNSV
jgi:tRNA1(Val) A37 N6-methylase TrmN6